MSFRKILVAVDGSPFAARAAEVAAELANDLGAQLALVHAVDPAVVAYAPEGGVPAGELIAAAEREGRQLLADFRERTSAQRPPFAFLEQGSPAAEIVRTAQTWAADLIVIGSHGRKGLERALLGSVAEAVVRHATCPVLVVR